MKGKLSKRKREARTQMSGKPVYQDLGGLFGVLPGPTAILLFMKRSRIKEVVVRTLIAVVLVMLFVSLLAQRLFHPR